MFERDARVHLERHVRLGEVAVKIGDLDETAVLVFFTEGPADHFPRPGGQTIVYGRVKVGKGRRAKGDMITAPIEDGPEIVEDDEPINSLDDILVS